MLAADKAAAEVGWAGGKNSMLNEENLRVRDTQADKLREFDKVIRDELEWTMGRKNASKAKTAYNMSAKSLDSDTRAIRDAYKTKIQKSPSASMKTGLGATGGEIASTVLALALTGVGAHLATPYAASKVGKVAANSDIYRNFANSKLAADIYKASPETGQKIGKVVARMLAQSLEQDKK